MTERVPSRMDHFITQVTSQFDDFHFVTMANMELPKENHFDVLVTSMQTAADVTVKIVTKETKDEHRPPRKHINIKQEEFEV